MITNKDKAKELDEKFRSFLYSPKEGLSFQQCLLEMAEWKEKQVIERAIKWLENEATKHIVFDCITEEPSLCYDFVELLVKVMKDE